MMLYFHIISSQQSISDFHIKAFSKSTSDSLAFSCIFTLGYITTVHATINLYYCSPLSSLLSTLTAFTFTNSILVERRRRETINEGINELAQIVPSCDKNKGAILQAAIQHINTLKTELVQKSAALQQASMVHEQALNEISTSNEKYKEELRKAWSRNVYLDTVLKSHGVIVDEEAGRDGNMVPSNVPSMAESRHVEGSGATGMDGAGDEEAEAEGDVEDDDSGDGANPALK